MSFRVGSLATTAAKIPLRPRCSGNDPRSPDNRNNDQGDRLSMDWDRAWSKFKNRGKKSLLSQFKPDTDKYVSWNPRRSEYPLAEEVDPIKRTERSNLTPWTSSSFTLAGAVAVLALLLIYTVLFILK